MSDYIVTKKWVGKALFDQVHLPYGTELELRDGRLFHEGKMLCRVASNYAYEYTARNDDGQGRLRGELINKIKQRLEKRNANYQKRWDRLWADEKACSLRRDNFDDFWVWGHAFYNASIEDLQHVWGLIKNL